jgi:outer membrane protein assembly factor BamB
MHRLTDHTPRGGSLRTPHSALRTQAWGLAALLGIVVGASAEDWPNWRGPRHDNVSTETGLIKTFPASGPKVLFDRPIPGGWSQPSISKGKLFITTEDQKQEVVLCLDPRTGQQLWDFRYACDYDRVTNLDQRFKSGPRSTPTVDGDRLYTLGTTGILHCLNVADGKPVWRKDFLEMTGDKCPEVGYTHSPLVSGELLFVHPGGQKGGSLAALNKKDGRVVWKSENDVLGYSTPLLVQHEGKPQLIYFTGTGAVAVTPDAGKVLWRYPWKTAFDLNVATPIYKDGQVFISSNYGHGAAMLRIQPGPEPKEVYLTKAMQNWFTSSILYKDHLYGLNDNRLTCLDWATGTMKWDQTGLGRGGLLIADGQLVILSERGEVVLADATPASFTERARWKSPMKAPCWTSPVLSNGVLYLRNQEQLIALDMKA